MVVRKGVVCGYIPVSTGDLHLLRARLTHLGDGLRRQLRHPRLPGSAVLPGESRLHP
jgi:hypothetical protein